MKKTDIAYMAGIIDGEGCIGIHRAGKKPNGNPQYFLRVVIGMCNEYIPNLFRFYFGGQVIFCQPRKENWNPQWRWAVTYEQAAQCLKILLPYLRLKRDEAILGLKFQSNKKHRGSPKGQNGGGIPETEEDLALQEIQRLLMHNLKNKSGVTNE